MVERKKEDELPNVLPKCAIMRIAGVARELNNFAKEIVRKNKLTLRLGGPPAFQRRISNHILLVLRSSYIFA